MSKLIDFRTEQEIRETLEGFPCPICTEGVSGTNLMALQLEVLFTLNLRFGTLDTEEEPDLEDAWWMELEKGAINDYSMSYYEDLED